MRPLAFVTPWYGPDIPGGMEAETRRTAEQLAAAGRSVEVWTTTIGDFYADWSHNAHRSGVTQLNGVTVRRFRVQPRDKAAFDAVNWALMNNRPISPTDEQTYITQQMRCPDLYDHIRRERDRYLFIFIPYMFATTVLGAQIAPERSLIIPCLHDEAYARLGVYRAVLPQAAALLLHTQAERNLADALFGPADQQVRTVIGEGVDVAFSAEPQRFRQKYDLHQPFVLYAGRREPGKNVPLLLQWWRQFVQQRDTDWQLVLIGPNEMTESAPNMRDLGFVSVQDKRDAMAAAAVFCQPSVNESFSIVLMESWLTGTPALVHGACAVTVEHCRRSNGGLYCVNSAEFAATLDYLAAHPQTAQRMGELGRDYVLANYTWPTIVDRYSAVLRQVEAAL